ncbi:MAG TPA: hypothetical protein VFZ59_24155 [Verrucomicrobiae bacterium]|nr:hypothetical protein [Verrucomicrobiae bacterium]
MKKKTQTLVAGLLMATLFFAPVAAIAQDKSEKPKTPAAGGAPDKSTPATRVLPFNGHVAAVDKDTKTVTVGKQVIHVSAETKLTKGNQSVTVADIAVGDAIAGSYTKGDDGKLTAKMMRVGPKPDSAQTEKKSSGKKKDEGSNARQ